MTMTVIDPDRVEASNLHRQVLYGGADVGAPKAARAAARIEHESGGTIAARAIEDRFTATNALELVREHSIVIEGTDRHEAKFLAADACVLARVPVVHAGIVRWAGWAMACAPFESACLRCVFEDVPRDADVATCGESGVIGAAVGTIGALQASLASGAEAAGVILRYDALGGVVRSSRVRRRAGCPLCGERATIRELRDETYAPACPA